MRPDAPGRIFAAQIEQNGGLAMELRYLRRFVVLAEELHFARAAERLYIEQSPLSRTIKALEDELGVMLFHRGSRGTRLTSAGVAFLQDMRRLFMVLEHARENAKAVAAGLRGSVRIAISDSAIDGRLPIFLARCREEAPEIELHICEVTLSEQLRGLRDGDFVFGLAHTADVGAGIVAESLWKDPLGVAAPIRHPLLAYQAIPPHALAGYPLILCDWQGSELSGLLPSLKDEAYVIERASSHDMMLALVSAGYGIGFITANRFALCRRSDVVMRPLAGDSAVMTTYLLRPANINLTAPLVRFIARLHER